MTPEQFTFDAKERIENAGFAVGYIHQDVSDPDLVYVASLETAPGCMGHPQAEAQYNHGIAFYTFNLQGEP